MPPFAVAHRRRDFASVLRKSLHLWPWRQYKMLAPHAHHCMPYITQLETLTESMAHLSLSLLQVFEYLSQDDEPAETYRMHKDHAHDIIDLVADFREASDGYLNLSIVLWRLTRAVVCTCHKDNDIFAKRCQRCKEATEAAMQFESNLESSQDALPTARVRAASFGFLMVLYLGGARLQPRSSGEIEEGPSSLFNAISAKRYRFDMDSLRNYILDHAPFNTWFAYQDILQSQMEKYIHNFSRYLQIRFSSEFSIGSIDQKLAEEVSRNYERLCGRNLEEYRRSLWYLTTSLEDGQDWSRVQEYLDAVGEVFDRLPGQLLVA